MAEAALIGVLLPKLMSLLEVKFTQQRNMHSELSMIKRELDSMKAFLIENDSDSTMEVSSVLDEDWVEKVRELAYDSEDIVDEFMLHFASDKPKTQKFFKSFKFISRINEIKSRAVAIRDSNKGYRLTDISLNSTVRRDQLRDPQQDAVFHDDELVGREIVKRVIIDNVCLRSVTMKIVSVFGTGGVGKTSLVKKVYDDDDDVKKTFETRAWISVSRTFSPEALLKNLIVQLQIQMKQPELGEFGCMRILESKQEVYKLLQNLDVIELQQTAKKILQRGKYLVVLDDIWTIEAWNAIRNTFPDSPDSKVLITTRNEEVALAASSGNVHSIFNLYPLSQDHWLELFCKKTPYDPDNFPNHLAKVTESILKKCAGVPLAIVSVRGVLFVKNRTAIEWEKINKNLGAVLDSSTKRVLSLGYADLPYYLKPCYLYLSIFPEDHKIEKNRLIRLWIAEGFVEKLENLTVEQVAESYLNELVQRSLIQVADIFNEGIVETYCIHDLLREIIIEKAKKQNFATVTREINGECSQPQQPRRLSLYRNLSILKEQQSLGRLRSLFMFELDQLPVNKLSVPSLFSKDFSFKMLTVLDMQGTILSEFPKNITKLRNLKYLNLSHTDLKSVPSSICSLLKLETLDLRYTYVTTLPREILKLQRLHSLLVYQYKDGTYPVFGFRSPAEIGRLQSLRSLFYVDAGSGCGAVVKQLGILTRLTRLGVTNFSNENARLLCASINKLSDLQFFSLSSSENEEQALDLQHLVFSSESLQCLYLTGKLKSFPSWMTSLQNLEKLFLRSCKLQTSPLETLGRLPNLVQLELVDACTAHKLVFKSAMFEKLRILDLHEFEQLVLVRFNNGSSPKLERFRMVSCNKMKKVPKGINHLFELTAVEFVNMPCRLKSKAKYIFEKMVHVKEANWVFKEQNDWKMERMTAARPIRPPAPIKTRVNVYVLQSSDGLVLQSSGCDDTPPNRSPNYTTDDIDTDSDSDIDIDTDIDLSPLDINFDLSLLDWLLIWLVVLCLFLFWVFGSRRRA